MEKIDILELEKIQAGGCSGSAGAAMGGTIAAGFAIALGSFTFGLGALGVAALATAWAWADCYSSGFN